MTSSPMVALAAMVQEMVQCNQKLNWIIAVFLGWDCPRSFRCHLCICGLDGLADTEMRGPSVLLEIVDGGGDDDGGGNHWWWDCSLFVLLQLEDCGVAWLPLGGCCHSCPRLAHAGQEKGGGGDGGDDVVVVVSAAGGESEAPRACHAAAVVVGSC